MEENTPAALTGIFFFFTLGWGKPLRLFLEKWTSHPLGKEWAESVHRCAEAEPPERSAAIICVSAVVSSCGSCLLAVICMSHSPWTQLFPQTSGVW